VPTIAGFALEMSVVFQKSFFRVSAYAEKMTTVKGIRGIRPRSATAYAIRSTVAETNVFVESGLSFFRPIALSLELLSCFLQFRSALLLSLRLAILDGAFGTASLL
jgi:hypothetical protein